MRREELTGDPWPVYPDLSRARGGEPRLARRVGKSCFKLTDAGDATLSLFDDNAYVYFPKHAPARGIKEVTQLFADLRQLFSTVVHEVAYFNYIVQDERVVVEGFTHGVLADGTPWRATEALGGRFCNVFEIRDEKSTGCISISTLTTATPTPPAIPGVERRCG